MGKPITCFEDIEAWQLAMELAERVITLTDSPKLDRHFKLRDQIHGAAISIPSNIAEGFERNSPADFSRFISIALGSCGELRTQLMLAQRIHFVPEATAESLIDLSRRVSRAAGAFRATLGPQKWR